MIGLRVELERAQESAKIYNQITHNMENAIYRAAGQEAHLLRSIMVLGIRQGAPGGKKFKPLKQATIDRKGGKSKPLIDQGDLIGSIKVLKMLQGELYFVGVHKMAPNDRANIAEVHEFGTKDGRIPARPFMRPSFNTWKKGIEQRMTLRLVDMLGLNKIAALTAAGKRSKVLADSYQKGRDTSGKFTSRFDNEINAVYKGGKLKFKAT